MGGTFSRKSSSHTLFKKLPKKEAFLFVRVGMLVRHRIILLTGFVSTCAVLSTRTAGSLGYRERLGTTNPIRSESCLA